MIIIQPFMDTLSLIMKMFFTLFYVGFYTSLITHKIHLPPVFDITPETEQRIIYIISGWFILDYIFPITSSEYANNILARGSTPLSDNNIPKEE